MSIKKHLRDVTFLTLFKNVSSLIFSKNLLKSLMIKIQFTH